MFFCSPFLEIITRNNCYPVGNTWGSNHQCQPPAGGLWKCQDCEEWQLLTLCKLLPGLRNKSFPHQRNKWNIFRLRDGKADLGHIFFFFFQGKFIRIHFGATGKLASADIETCKRPSRPDRSRSFWLSSVFVLSYSYHPWQICWRSPGSLSSSRLKEATTSFIRSCPTRSQS